ncbi:MAG: energy transducer TonB [Gemmatimonadota bacterium]
MERLKALGPIYTPYEVSPRLRWDEDTQRLLVETLAPVLEENELPVGTHALVWVLIGADGAVADAVIQTTSESEAFDEAALKVAKGLRFLPAGVGGQPVAVWVIREISLTME